jgi:hypothetical protein
MKYIFYIALVLNFCCVQVFKIETSILFCDKSSEIIDLDIVCQQEKDLIRKIICFSLNNDLQLKKEQFNDEYKYLFTLNDKKVFYFGKSNIFMTNCFNLNKFEIIENFNECTKDLEVNFEKDGKLVKAYLTKDEILRSDSKPIECIDEIFLSIDNNKFNILREKKNVKIIESPNKSTASKYHHETNIRDQNSNIFTQIFDQYENNFEYNWIFQITKDSLAFILFVAFMILFIIIFTKNKKKNLSHLIKSILNTYVKKDIQLRNDKNDKENSNKQALLSQLRIDKNDDKENPKRQSILSQRSLNNSKLSVSFSAETPKKIEAKRYSLASEEHICQICRKIWPSARSLSSHMKAHKDLVLFIKNM